MYTKIDDIEARMESEMAESQAAMNERSTKSKEVSGLHQGICEVASNVTLVVLDKRIDGKESKVQGRLSVHDYELKSQADREKRRSQLDRLD